MKVVVLLCLLVLAVMSAAQNGSISYDFRFKLGANLNASEPQQLTVVDELQRLVLDPLRVNLITSSVRFGAYDEMQTLVTGSFTTTLEYNTSALRNMAALKLADAAAAATGTALSVLRPRNPTFNIIRRSGEVRSGLSPFYICVKCSMGFGKMGSIPRSLTFNLTREAIDTFTEFIDESSRIMFQYDDRMPADAPQNITYAIKLVGESRIREVVQQAADGEMKLAAAPLVSRWGASAMWVSTTFVAVGAPLDLEPIPPPSPAPPGTVPEERGDDDDTTVTVVVAVVVSGVVVTALVSMVVVVIVRRQDPSETGELRPVPAIVRVVKPNQQGSAETDSSSIGNSSDSHELEPRKMPTSAICVIDEPLVLLEGETNTSSWSVPTPCVRGHMCEKTVVVTCDHHDGKKPRKATDLKTLFGKEIGHVWKCAYHSHSQPETHDPYLIDRRSLTLSIGSVVHRTIVVHNSVTLVFDAVATLLAEADHVIAQSCSCPTNLRVGKHHKVPVTIAMSIPSSPA